VQIVRTIVWVLVLLAIFTFSAFNWRPIEVTLWDGIVLETKIPALVIIAFLLGLVPMWLYHRSVGWSLGRRIRSLENSIKSTAMARRHDPAASQDASKAADKPVENPEESAAKQPDLLAPAATPDETDKPA
jgi:hypothetical protein